MCTRKIVFIVSVLLFMGGCITNADRNPHNDVLIFGTSTKFALDVSAAVQNAGIPEFTLGYKRLEAVWMPLKPGKSHGASDEEKNIADRLTNCVQQLLETIPDIDRRNKVCLIQIIPSDKYVSIASGVDPKSGGSELEIDTYSVFASLGANGSLSNTNATGGIAQFFATGVAAQRLGANPQIGVALNTGGANAEAKKAEAKAKEAEVKIEQSKEVQALIAGGASASDAATIAKGTTAARLKNSSEILIASACINAWSGSVPGGITNANAIALMNSYHTHNNIGYLKADLQDDAARLAILKECNK